MHSVVPVIRWIDDKQEHRQRPIIYIGVETMMDNYQKPVSSVQKAVRQLIEHYQVLFVAPALDYTTTESCLTEYFRCSHLSTDISSLPTAENSLYGDYLIAAPEQESLEGAL